MKHFIAFSVLFISTFCLAQTVIYEKQFDEKEIKILEVGESAIDNKILLKILKPSSFYFSDLISIDENGTEEVILKNDKYVNLLYSRSPGIYKVDGDKVKYIFGSTVKYVEDKSYNGNFYNIFNEKYEVNIGDKKGESADILKDDLYFEIYDINLNKKTRILVEKPNTTRLKGDNFVKTKSLWVDGHLNENSINVSTDAISKDYHNFFFYKTSYDFNGKLIGDTTFKIELKDKFLISSYSAKDNEFFGRSNKTISGLTNGYYIDNANGEFYFYGLFSDKEPRSNGVKPMGFYVFKFDKEGHKIWESINKLEDKEDLNDFYSVFVLKVSFKPYLDGYNFSVFTNDNKEFLHYANLDSNGKLIKKNKLIFKESSTSSFNNNTYLKSGIPGFTNLKNKSFDLNTIMAVDSNEKIRNYLNDYEVVKGEKVDIITYFLKNKILIVTKTKKNVKIISF